MNICEWLDQKRGRTSEMALHFGVTSGAISQWRSGVPYGRMREIEAFTVGEVTIQEMVHQRLHIEQSAEE